MSAKIVRLSGGWVVITLSVLFLQSCLHSDITTESDGSDTDSVLDSSSRVSTENDFQSHDTMFQNFYVAHLDNDSIPDSLFIMPPIVNDNGDEYVQDCQGPCITKISFSNNLPPIYVQQSLGGEIKVLEDINENGYSEIVFFPYWFQSCWSRMDIFSFNDQNWSLVKSIDYNSCDETLPTNFEKVDKGVLRVITNGYQFEENSREIEQNQQELPGLEAKIYDVEVK
ncbi:MAG: hypothetical protein M0R38_02295 [Bacteroidia bacterium]|nr:hypothetical protein [Bacteroidia bacterium]